MPSSEQILNSLHTVANQWQMVAILWHGYFAVLAVALLAGIRPSRRVGGILMGLPLLSVSLFAWLSANPFNGLVFAITGGTLLILAMRQPATRLRIAPRWGVIAGIVMFLFGWAYPHFLDTASPVPYLYAAPTGLIPCPTLSIVIGLALIVDRLEARTWSLVLGAAGIFYGLFGALRLGVAIDWMLFLGASILIILVLRNITKRTEVVTSEIRQVTTG